ncbi:MAG: PAS-domain containing protein [Vannielia sp.]|uniref:PAS domain-containing hybrid sensor histidine kinase/response regulator n=1 Tax=Rhodobacterales TaxID=204455 RepID=UPI0020961D48|nr:PAS-domain containing protein [Oceanicola sp. 502str15]MCO6382089.1 response regulator [Oceanicola sp. 502str15]
MIDPDDPLEVQVEKQAKIIAALVRRAGRQNEVGSQAYGAFQSAIALQGQVWAKTRDLERASSELSQLRHDRERSQKNLADALSVMEGGFALFEEGRLRVCNELFRSLLPDLSERILPGLTLAQYFDAMEQSAHLEPDEEQIAPPLRTRREGGTGAALSSFVIALRGDRWFQISQQGTGGETVIVLQTEITDIVRKNRSEKAQLIDLQAHYLQAAIDHMTLGLCTVSAEGTVTLHNDRFRELLGLPFTLVQSGTYFTEVVEFIRENYLIDSENMALFDGWMERAGNDGRLRQTLRHASGRVLDMHTHALPDRGFLVDIKDVTLEYRATELLERRVSERTAELTRANARLTTQFEELARVQEALRLAKEEAEAANSSKTRFLAAASHDLLQPINAAKLLISTLYDMSRDSPMGDTVDRLDGAFASMEQLLHALLDISRLESSAGTLDPVDFSLSSVIQTVTQDQQAFAARKGVRLSAVPSSLWVRSDQRYLFRSIQNLVVNAIQYTETGRVLVGCRRRPGNRVELQVWDTGIGISRKDQRRIFEEFTRADNVPPGSGMGLGLSIVDRTCRHLGHRVSVRSKPGVGSVFSIEMEAVAAQAPIAEAVMSPGEGDFPEMDLIVLVVENDAAVLDATTRKLERWGASVLAARGTAEALEMVRDLGLAPDIVLADHQLDGADTGTEAIRALRAATGQQVPAIMITANRSPELAQTGVEQDFAVLPKPVDLSRLRPLMHWKARAAMGQGMAPTKVSRDGAAP